jgi:hypothetical protein
LTIPITLELTSGRSRTFSRATPNDDGTFGGIFGGTETITATIWPADSQVAVLTVAGAPNTWIDAALSQWSVTFVDAQTAGLVPGVYRLEVTSSTSVSGETARLFEGLLEVTSSAGTFQAVPSDLITAAYCAKQLTGLVLSAAEIEVLPDRITAACDYVRKWCGQRDFTLLTYTEEYYPEYDGTIALKQMPVQYVSRARGYLQTALSISNPSSANQIAYVGFSYSGDVWAGTQVTTGLILTSVASGVVTVINLPWTAYPLIANLTAAINSAGFGWTCLSQTFGAWPVTELTNGYVATGAVTADAGGVNLKVYSQDLGCSKLNQRTGVMSVGLGAGGGFGFYGFRGGYDWAAQDSQDETNDSGRVLVTYTAGFTVIPPAIQQFTAELVKASIVRFRRDHLLKSEHAGQYSYEITDKDLGAMPIAVKEQASLYRIRRIA